MASQSHATPRDAAAVILLRERSPGGQAEVFLLRRHSKSSFMSSAYVFPGGAADPDESDLRVTAARELFEEAGVLLSQSSVTAEQRIAWQAEINAGERSFAQLLAQDGARPEPDLLEYYAHWITPSVEKKRFSARFFVAVLPAGQQAHIDEREAVDEVWLTPAEALERAGELRLPPPQVRTFWDLRDSARRGVDAVIESARQRARHRHAILPRIASIPSPVTLLLPWDREYHRLGVGESLAMPADHPLACGPSRIVLEDMTWKQIAAPSSPSAE